MAKKKATAPAIASKVMNGVTLFSMPVTVTQARLDGAYSDQYGRSKFSFNGVVPEELRVPLAEIIPNFSPSVGRFTFQRMAFNGAPAVQGRPDGARIGDGTLANVVFSVRTDRTGRTYTALEGLNITELVTEDKPVEVTHNNLFDF